MKVFLVSKINFWNILRAFLRTYPVPRRIKNLSPALVPRFNSGSCFPSRVPSSSDFLVRDEGPSNAELLLVHKGSRKIG